MELKGQHDIREKKNGKLEWLRVSQAWTFSLVSVLVLAEVHAVNGNVQENISH